MNCPKCGSSKLWSQKTINYKNGTKGKVYQCAECRKYFTIKLDSTIMPEVKQTVPEEKQNGKKIGISLDEIIRTHDVDELIKQGLEQLKKGVVYTEQEFIDIAKLRGKQYRANLESPDMKIYRGKIDGTTYYATPEDIETLRNRFIMR